MEIVLDLKLLVLISVANGTPVAARRIFGRRFSYPLDCRLVLADGEPLFGVSKSVRGVALALIFTTLASPIVGVDWRLGVLIAALAMAGDLCSSFLKRRMKLPESSMAIGLDQIPESLLPAMGCAFFLPLSAMDIAAIGVSFFLCEIFLSRLFYKLHLRERPY